MTIGHVGDEGEAAPEDDGVVTRNIARASPLVEGGGPSRRSVEGGSGEGVGMSGLFGTVRP